MVVPGTPVVEKHGVVQAFGVDVPVVEVCDVGAMAEGVDRYAGLVKQNLARVTGFEPNAAERAKLEAREREARDGAKRRYLPYFLGRGGAATFHMTRYPGCSSLYEPDPAVIDRFTSIGATLPAGNFAVFRTEAVETTRLDDVEGAPVFDYLKLDVQGAELDVLAGGPRTVSAALIIETEVEFVAMYKGQPLFGDLQCHLRERGFMLHKFVDVAGRSFAPFMLKGNPLLAMSQLLWADAIFIRDIFHLDGWTDEQLIKAATILYDCYDSHDLVHRLLAEYDRRRQTNLAGRLMESLRKLPRVPLLYMNTKTHA